MLLRLKSYKKKERSYSCVFEQGKDHREHLSVHFNIGGKPYVFVPCNGLILPHPVTAGFSRAKKETPFAGISSRTPSTILVLFCHGCKCNFLFDLKCIQIRCVSLPIIRPSYNIITFRSYCIRNAIPGMYADFF